MATIQKTTLKRYNGTDWDPVYLANSADISYLGTGFVVAEGTGFTVGENVSATESTSALLQKVINNLTAVDKTKIPALQSGEAITALVASKLTGVVSRANLPTDVSGKGIEVATEEEKAALTKADVNVGDLVKVTNGKVYLVNAVSDAAVTYMELTDSASEIAWSRITGTPTTLAGYGITDAVNANEKVTVASASNAGKILVLNAEGKLDASITGDAPTLEGHAASYFATKAEHDAVAGRVTTAESDIDTLQSEIKAIDAAWITSGVISIDRLPSAVIERMYIAAKETDLASLTTEQVQNGDTVKVVETGNMYYVVDDTKLGTADYMQGLSQYTAGIASQVDWSGVVNKPTTLADYGITDAVNANEKVTEATAANKGKILVIGDDGKLNASITGDAATLEGHAASYFATKSEHDTLAGRVTTAEGEIDALQAVIGDDSTGLAKDVATMQGEMTTAKEDIVNLKAGTAITALAANKITGTLTRAQLPADISGRLIKKADLAEAKASLTAENASIGDLVKCADGTVYVVVDTTNLNVDAGYESIVNVGGATIKWSQLTDIPTSLAAMNWSDAVTTAMLVDTASVANAGKLLKINAAGKLDASITGDAASIGGHAPAYFATKEEHDALATRMTTAEGEIDQLQADIKDIDAAWITKGTISIDRLPHGALERCAVVATEEARLALTTDQVQTGDTVKVTETGKMYFVVDDSKLSEEAGYEVYTAGTATAVDWSGVQNTPTTLAGYGITDAVHSNEKVTVASAGNVGKILVLNAEGKLDVDITGHVDWANINDKPTSTVEQIDEAVATATHTNRAVLDKLGVDGDGHLTYDSKAVAFKSELDEVALGALKVVDAAPATATVGQLVLEAI
jgi:putative tail fiber-related protein